MTHRWSFGVFVSLPVAIMFGLIAIGAWAAIILGAVLYTMLVIAWFQIPNLVPRTRTKTFLFAAYTVGALLYGAARLPFGAAVVLDLVAVSGIGVYLHRNMPRVPRPIYPDASEAPTEEIIAEDTAEYPDGWPLRDEVEPTPWDDRRMGW